MADVRNRGEVMSLDSDGSVLRGISRALKASTACGAMILALAPATLANPYGSTVVSGSVKLTTPATGTLQVTQKTDVVIIDWKGFNIASGETTTFVQPSTTSLAVNRIGSSSPSQIQGNLNANGRIILINANGIVFGSTAQVNVGSLVATASDATDADLATKKATFGTAGNANAQVVNQGSITAAQGGVVGLIAPAVSNTGTITAKLGTVQLGASNQATVDFSGDGLISFPVTGTIAAVPVKSGTPVSALVQNSGTISGGTIAMNARTAASLVTKVISMAGTVTATAASSVGGKIVLDGGAAGDVGVTGTLNADGTSGGSISVTSAGTTAVSKTLSAKNTSTSGTGGAITTAGKTLTVSGTITAGNGGSWMLEAANFTLDSTRTALITGSLAAGTNTTLQIDGGGSTSGDLTVAKALTWSGTGSLTLNAYRNLNVNAAITNTGSGSLMLHADNGAQKSGTVTFGSGITANWSGSTGNVGVIYRALSYGAPTSFSSKVTLHSGSKLTAYMAVDSSGDLNNVRKNLNGVYALNANISASTLSSFQPIGLDSLGNVDNSGNGFNGTFDGFNHTINDLTLSSQYAGGGTAYTYVGLFGYVGSKGIVRNVGLTNVTATNTFPGSIVATLVGKNMGTVSGSYAKGKVTDPDSLGYIGGLVGSNRGTISSSWSSATVTGGEPGLSSYVGGLAEFNAGTITKSYATGAVSGGGSVGGLVGHNEGAITSSYAKGAVSNGDSIGGLIGEMTAGTVNSSYAKGTVSGAAANAGGLIGTAGSSDGTVSVTSSYALGSVTDTSDAANVGGLIGFTNYNVGITSSHAGGVVTGGPDANVGGLVGYFNWSGLGGSSISSSYATGSVLGGSHSSDGGLVGTNDGPVSNSYASGSVSGTDYSQVGGVIGLNMPAGVLTSITANGSPAGGTGSYVGGVVGMLDGGSINGCSASYHPLVGFDYSTGTEVHC